RPSLAAVNTERRRQLRGDLDVIALTALRKEPERRYASVAALADDVRRHLDGRPIRARKNTTSYVARRFVRRNGRRIAGAVALSAIGLLLGFVLFRSASQPQTKVPSSKLAAADNPDEATHDPEARQLFLRARTLVYEFGTGPKYQESLTSAVRLLEQATTRDPNFVLAYSLLAEAHLYLYERFEHDNLHAHAGKAAADAAQRLAAGSGAAHFAQALYFYVVGRDLPRAENEVIAALRAAPTSIDALQLAPEIERRLGKFKEALDHCEQAIALDPRDPALIPVAAEIYTALRRYTDTERIVDRALAVVPPQFAAPLWRKKAAAALAQGDTKAARAALAASPMHSAAEDYLLLQIAVFERNFAEATERADGIKAEPMQKWVLLFRGLLARARGDEARSREAFSAARDLLEKDLATNPDDPTSLSYVALVEAGLGEKEEAIRQAQRAVELSHDAVEGAQVATVQAKVYAWVGENEVALNKLAALLSTPYAINFGALALDPGWDGLRDDPRFAKLMEEARRPIDLVPKTNQLRSDETVAVPPPPTSDLVAYDLYLRGKALIDDIATSTDWEGDNRRAIELLNRAVTHDPTFALAFATLCRLHLNLHGWVDQTPARLGQAEAALQHAMRLAPGAFETRLADAIWAASTGDCPRALEVLRGLQQERPDDAYVVRQIGQAEECAGMWAEAVLEMERAKQLAPGNSNIPNILKETYSALRDYRNSDRVCDEAIARFPNGPNYYRAHKVANSIWRGDVAKARAQLAEVPEQFDPSGYRSVLSVTIAFAERDLERFNREVADLPWDHFIDEMKMRVDFMRALVAEQQGNRPLLESIVLPLREKLAAREQQPGRRSLSPAPSILGSIARIDSYLGRLDDALAESEQAVATQTAPIDAPGTKLIRAEVLMRAGQTDHAFELLEEVATVPCGPSYGELLSLRWDRLRGDARFERIVQQLAKSAKI
ncbi:MAG: hypothetical protein M3032_06775, partial [Verrucomicrobiota bacterium]|nr:hypothetical protein [Verrucomicrobiota bacterium]